MKHIINTEDDYEDLLAQWSNLESGLGVVLGHPDSVQEFVSRIAQYDRWMQDLLGLDADVGLYLLFQLAINSPVGYSASHALACAVLCQLMAQDLALPAHERDGLVRAALTMNIAMTTLQDQLANQSGRPGPEQQIAINTHADQGALMLGQLGITDPLWLEIVQRHHQQDTQGDSLGEPAPARRLARVLHVVDRYAALISPRQSREGRSAAESAQRVLHDNDGYGTPVGQTLVRLVGLCPPGTVVQLDNDEVALVVRRSAESNLPELAVVINEFGQPVKPPRLHRTAVGIPRIKAALAASVLQERISHHVILQLGAQGA